MPAPDTGGRQADGVVKAEDQATDSTLGRTQHGGRSSDKLAVSICRWRNNAGDPHHVMTIAYFDKLGLPRLS